MLTLSFADDGDIVAVSGPYVSAVEVLPEAVPTSRVVTYLDPDLHPGERPIARLADLSADVDTYSDALAPVAELEVRIEHGTCRYCLPSFHPTVPDLHFATLDELVRYLRWSLHHAEALLHGATAQAGGAR